MFYGSKENLDKFYQAYEKVKNSALGGFFSSFDVVVAIEPENYKAIAYQRKFTHEEFEKLKSVTIYEICHTDSDIKWFLFCAECEVEYKLYHNRDIFVSRVALAHISKNTVKLSRITDVCPQLDEYMENQVIKQRK